MAGETTQGHAAWITVGAGGMLGGLGITVTNALAASPSRTWQWVGICLIVVGFAMMIAALCHQFRHILLRRLLKLGLREEAYAGGVPTTETIFRDLDTGKVWRFGEIHDLKEAEKRHLEQQRPDVWSAYRGRLFRDLIFPPELRSQFGASAQTAPADYSQTPLPLAEAARLEATLQAAANPPCGFLDEAGEQEMRLEADAAFDLLSSAEKCLLRALVKHGPLSPDDLLNECARDGHDVRPLITPMESESPKFLQLERSSRPLRVRCMIAARYRKYLAGRLS